MADVKISGLPASSTPLAGTEVLPIVQGGVTDQVSVANLTAGRAVSALSLTTTADCTVNNITIGKGGGNSNFATAVGRAALNATNTQDNAAFGWAALYANTSGGQNAAFGSYNTLYSNTTGSYNCAFGREALQAVVSSSNNTAMGYQAGYSVTGAGNQLFGYQSGYGVTSGTNNTIIGAYTGAAAPISATGSNYVVISDGAANVRAYWNGSIAIFNGTISPVQAATVSAPAYVKGAIYFDTTLNKLRVGGATGWETITSV